MRRSFFSRGERRFLESIITMRENSPYPGREAGHNNNDSWRDLFQRRDEVERRAGELLAGRDWESQRLGPSGEILRVITELTEVAREYTSNYKDYSVVRALDLYLSASKLAKEALRQVAGSDLQPFWEEQRRELIERAQGWIEAEERGLEGRGFFWGLRATKQKIQEVKEELEHPTSSNSS